MRCPPELCVFLSCRLPQRQPAGDEARGGNPAGSAGSLVGQEHHGSGSVRLGGVRRLHELRSGLASAGIGATQPRKRADGTTTTFRRRLNPEIIPLVSFNPTIS